MVLPHGGSEVKLKRKSLARCQKTPDFGGGGGQFSMGWSKNFQE